MPNSTISEILTPVGQPISGKIVDHQTLVYTTPTGSYYISAGPAVANTSTKAAPAANQAPAGERKYFKLDVDLSLSSAPVRIWVNKSKLNEGFPADSKLPFQGLQFSEPPKIAFDRTKRRGALLDVDTIMLGIWLVSDRLKTLLERIDPEAFAFVRADVDYSNFDEQGPGYWFCDIVRMLDCIDDERSKVTYYDNVPFKAYDALIDVKMQPEAVGTAHAFRLTHATLKQIVDDVLVNAVKAEKIKGFRFIDIQQAQTVRRNRKAVTRNK